jgi:vacuolar-type H+-ATPase subunit E/Vma4
MAVVEGSIEALSRAILAEARAETDQLKTQAEAKADQIRRRAEVEADRERKTIVDQALQEAERLRSQALASAQLKSRAMELAHREQMLDKVFSGVAQALSSATQRRDYQEIAIALVREGLAQLRSGHVQIRADAGTVQHLTQAALQDISKSMQTEVTLGEALEHGTGVVLEASEGRLTFDNTLETRLARIQGQLRAQVYRILMGETE